MRAIIVEDLLPCLDITQRSDGKVVLSMVDMSLFVISNLAIINADSFLQYVEFGIRVQNIRHCNHAHH